MIVGSETSGMKTERVISLPPRSYDKLFVVLAETATKRFKSDVSSMTSSPNLVMMSPAFRPALAAALPAATSVTRTPATLLDDEALARSGVRV
jgi:hypothetical protein